MFKVKSLYQLFFYSIIFMAVLFSFFTIIILYDTFGEFKQKIKTIKRFYINKHKSEIKQDMENIIKLIKFYHKRSKTKEDEKLIKNDLIKTINAIKNDKTSKHHTFIYDFNGTFIYSSNKKELYKLINSKEPNIIKNLIDFSKKDNKFVKYAPAGLKEKKQNNKIYFTTSYKPWKWTIIKTANLNNIKKVITNETKKYNKKISHLILQIAFLTMIPILYFILIFKNNRFLFIFNKEPRKLKEKKYLLKNMNKKLQPNIEKKTKKLNKLLKSQKKFLKNSIHEINTPLAVIQTNIDLLKNNIPHNRYISNIQTGIKVIQYIYEDLSFIVQKDKIEYKKKYLNFSTILQRRVDFFEELAKINSLFFILDVAKELYIKFNELQLQRIIDNNLSNAIKYSHIKSPIYIKLKYINDYFVEFEIETFSEEINNKDKIFHSFYRENSFKKGLGLGLKIVKEICDENSVIIGLVSNKQKTKFTYRFNINENIAS